MAGLVCLPGVVVQPRRCPDAALDVPTQVHGEPMYNMIGGRVKESLPIYATTCRPDLAKDMG